LSLLRETIKETTIADRLLLTALIVFSLSALLLVRSLSPSGNRVIIEVEGRKAYILSLGEDRIVDVEGPIGTTRVEVRGGKVRVVESPCTYRICIRQGWITKGSIICLPNRVVVTVGKDGERDIDAISG
jgi:hypothetical protein